MLSPEKKRKSTATTATEPAKKKKPSPNPPQSISILSLPHELLLSCLARLSRLYYPTLSLVSKSFRSIISSPGLYKARSILGKTESCLYVCMHFYRDRNPTWFTLCLKPTQTLTNCNSKEKKKKKSSAYVLAKVPIPTSPYINISGLVSVGSCIYNISRASFLHHVSILDCRSHTWQDSPSLPVEVTSLTASVLDGKIYVAGCYEDDDESMNNCLEIFDTKTKIWDPVPVPCLEVKEIFSQSQSVSIDGKFHVTTGLGVAAYSPKEGVWKLAGDDDGMRQFMLHPDSYCVIGNVLYSVYERVFRWYDSKVNKWRNLKGLRGLPEFPDNVRVKLADNGGKMLVLWDELVDDDSEKMIWFAEIELVRRKRCEIWGLVEWFDHVVTLPLGYDFVKVLSATV